MGKIRTITLTLAELAKNFSGAEIRGLVPSPDPNPNPKAKAKGNPKSR